METSTLHALLAFFPLMLAVNAIEVGGVKRRQVTGTVVVMAYLGAGFAAFGCCWALCALAWPNLAGNMTVPLYFSAFLSLLCATLIAFGRIGQWAESKERGNDEDR